MLYINKTKCKFKFTLGEYFGIIWCIFYFFYMHFNLKK